MNAAKDAGKCPDENVLAAFAEGKSKCGERQTVERHMADCAECANIVSGVVRLLANGSRDGELRHPRAYLAVAAMVAMLAVSFALLKFRAPTDPLRDLWKAASTSGQRTIEGWVSHSPYAPFGRNRSANELSVDLNVRAAAESLIGAGTKDVSDHTRGVALLYLGDAAGATAALELAARRTPEDPDVWNDLSVAVLSHAIRSRDRADLHRAVTAADRAVALAPLSATAYFNRGLALEHLGASTDARHSYARSAALLPPSAWREEVAAHLDR
ncbi:MAG TPA: tetratricopeptide repeat protein [Thermoanaerobaculia bacterium]|nr:tetratricopeptide repeat protein [Thermoanaerobaculia bacterium]